jgi:hypothetical protein
MATTYRRRWQLQRLEGRLAPATITVTTLADNTTVDGKVSLREALQSANGNANFNADVVAVGTYGMAADIINFDSTLFSTPQSIKLLTALPNISDNVQIVGLTNKNVTITRDAAAPNIRLFNCAITGTGSVTFTNLTLTGAMAGALNGAAIAAGDDNVTISNCVISNNQTTGAGGAIHVAAGGGTILVTNSTISGNSAQRGGGIYFFTTGTLTMDNCTVSGNLVSGANGGGAFYFYTNTASIRNSTISGNSALSGRGGGLTLQSSANIAIRNSTITNNSASTTGGGIHRNNGTVSLESTIVAGNTATTSGSDIQGSVTADFSLIGIADNGPIITGSNNKTGTKASPLDAKLSPLAFNGGPTQTHALTAASPAINVGANSTGLTTDQRGPGFVRAFGVPDIGAFEFQNEFVVTNTNDSGTGSLRQVLLNTNANPGIDLVTFSPITFSSAKTITLATGALPIQDSVVIQGPSAELTISGDNSTRVIEISGSIVIDVNISKLTLTKGAAPAFISGGAIRVQSGNVTLNEVVLRESSAQSGGGIAHIGPGKLVFNDSQIVNNLSRGVDSVVETHIFRTKIAGNTGSGLVAGGGLIVSGNLVMLDSAVTDNISVSSGGGLSLTNAMATTLIRNSTISGNKASDNGGGIAFSQGSLTIQNSTITNNTASGAAGGGIARTSGTGTISLASTIVSGNFNASSPDISSAGTVNVNFSAVGASMGFTLSGSSGNNLPFQPHANLLLSALGNFGGTTQSHHPNPGSPLINAGSNPGPTGFDQRGIGFVRSNGQTDIGAVEVQSGQFVVTNANDAGVGSLRYAVQNSNGNPGTDLIVFDPVFFSVSRVITLTTGQLSVTDSVNINGPGPQLAAISGNNASRIMAISSGSALLDVTISGLTLAQGNASGLQGGAIASFGENLTVANCVISGNSANSVGGILVLSPGYLNLIDSQIVNNSASFDVGGVGSSGGVNIVRSSISGNMAGGISGGLYVRNGLKMDDSTVANNLALTMGGGFTLVNFTPSTFLIRNSTISGNTAGNGGGILLGYSSSFQFNSTLMVQNSTITNNSAGTGTGGGIARLFGTGTIDIESSICAGNTNGVAPDIFSTGTVNLKTSLVGNGLGFVPTDLGGNLPFGTKAKLAPLADNGGPTWTHALLPGSPAINAGSNPSLVLGDQRGFARVFGGAADMGAVEQFVTSVASINRVGAEVSKAASVQWTVNLSHSITGLSPFNFQLSGAGATGAAITTVTGSGKSYTVTATTGSDGPVTLNLVNSTGVVDAANNPLGYLPFAGQSYTIDKTAPQVLSVTRMGPAATNAASVQWTVTFNESVSGGAASNFTLVNTGLGGTPSITMVSGTGTTRLVTASTGTGTGTLGLNFTSATGISDAAENVVSNAPLTGEVYTVDRTAPTVTITTNAPTINDAKVGSGALAITATFNENMDTTVAPTFSFPVENPAPSINFASGSWTNANTFVGLFNVLDLNVELLDIDVRVSGGKDAAGNAHSQTTKTDLIDLDTQNPIINSMSRNDPSANKLATVGWTVTFSEAVTGVTASNFLLFNGGLGGSVAITEVMGAGTTWSIKASTGTGQGTLALYVVSSTGVIDAMGNSLAALPVVGPGYVVDHIAPQAAQLLTNTLTIADANVGPMGLQVTVVFNEIMDQTTIPTVSFPVENPGATLSLALSQWLDAKTFRATYAVADLNVELADIDIAVSGGKDAVGNLQTPLTVPNLFDIDTLNPTVAKIQINDGSMQLSRVTSLTITFSEVLAFPGMAEDAFNLVGPLGTVSVSADLSESTSTQTIVKLTFSGASTEFDSLRDGKYTLTVLANQVLDTAGNLMTSNSTTQFHRLFGDADGNGSVTAADFAAFRLAYGTNGPSIFDFDNNGSVSAADFNQFRLRYGGTILP